MARHELWELKQMQSLPLQAKIQMTRYRIRQWVDEFGEDGVYVSFSGGKDSTVLLDIVRKDYPNIEAVFVNTGLEYPSVSRFATGKENVTALRPTMGFRDVICKYGYPVISKEVALKVKETRKCPNGYASKSFNGERENTAYDYSSYSYLLNSPFSISDMCCNVMKKAPIKKYEKSKNSVGITAQMAGESKARLTEWLRNGCNAFDKKRPISNPMSFWTENDVLQYIHENNLPIAEAYGDVIVKGTENGQMCIAELFNDYRDCQYVTTGCKRTGCTFCMFGIIQDKDRFIRLAEQEPKLCDYVMRGGKFFYRIFNRKRTEIKLKHCTHNQIEKWCTDNANNQNFEIESMWQPSKSGLGYWFVIEWLNVHGNLKIGMPDREKYLSEYQTEETRKYLVKEVV